MLATCFQKIEDFLRPQGQRFEIEVVLILCLIAIACNVKPTSNSYVCGTMTIEIKEALDECIRRQRELEKTYPSHVRSVKLSILVLMAGKKHVPRNDDERKEWLKYVELNVI